MITHHILNSKEIKKIKAMLKEQFGIEKELEYAFLLSEKEKLYIINRDVARIDFAKVRVSALGLYFATLRNDELRLSLEGAQLVGPYATKNVLELTTEQLKEYFKGRDLDLDLGRDDAPFLILTHKGDVVGCGKYKNKTLLNFVSKIHRTEELIVH